MTTATQREDPSRPRRLEVFGFLVLACLNIGVARYWPGSLGSTIVTAVFLSWAAFWLAMLLLGVAGVIAAMDWLAKGEPSEQFTHTRWFQRRRRPG